jgi:hypothetical protein
VEQSLEMGGGGVEQSLEMGGGTITRDGGGVGGTITRDGQMKVKKALHMYCKTSVFYTF